MIELYLDTVGAEQVRRLNVCLPYKGGGATNPSILEKAGKGVNHASPKLANYCNNCFSRNLTTDPLQPLICSLRQSKNFQR